jgi:hypothetical protein
MKGIVTILMVLTMAAVIAAPLGAQAAGKKAKGEVVMKVGKKVHLFHSGTADVKSEIALNDLIPVYRATTIGYQPAKTQEQVKTLKEVGLVKVLSYIDEHHFEAEIMKGEIKVGDIAKKDAAGLLVQP